jgi:Tol biopolymer transport system component
MVPMRESQQTSHTRSPLLIAASLTLGGGLLVLMLGAGRETANPAAADIAFASHRDGNWEIYLMAADGQHQRRLTRRSTEERFPLWSPDRRQIAFGSMVGASFGTGWELWVMNADGTGQRRLASHIAAKSARGWSPDGKRIAYTATANDDVDIYTVEVQSGRTTRLTSAPDDDRDPSWSPDGTQLAFASSRDGTSQVYVMSADGRNRRRLTNEGTAALAPRWSPDGKAIAYTGGGDSGRDLYLVPASGGPSRRLTTYAHLTRDAAHWSPDGSRIAYQMADGKNYNIGIAQLAKSPHAPSLIAASPEYDGSFTWSPDGTRLAFISGRDGSDAVYVTDVEGTRATRLTSSSSLTPAWR